MRCPKGRLQRLEKICNISGSFWFRDTVDKKFKICPNSGPVSHALTLSLWRKSENLPWNVTYKFTFLLRITTSFFSFFSVQNWGETFIFGTVFVPIQMSIIIKLLIVNFTCFRNSRSHVIRVFLPSQSASEKHNQEKPHKPLRASWTSRKIRLSCLIIIKSCYFGNRINKPFTCSHCVICVSCSVHVIPTYYERKGS